MKIISILFMVSLSFLSALAHDTLILSDGQPHTLLAELFTVLGEQTDGTVKQMDEVLQKKYFCKPGQERWHLKEIHHDKRIALMKIFTQLGLVNEIIPSEKQYDTIIIHGATVATMRKRINYLQQLWRKGLIQANKIVVITGERPLEKDHDFDNEKALLTFDKKNGYYNKNWQRPKQLPQTEGQAAKLLWDQIITESTLRAVAIEFITVDMIVDPKTHETRRPRTRDTVEKWLAGQPKLGRYLAISNNPHIHSQDQTVFNILSEHHSIEAGATIETVGPSSKKDTSIAEYLDTVARWLHSEIEGRKLISG